MPYLEIAVVPNQTVQSHRPVLIDFHPCIQHILNKHGIGTLYFGVKPNGDVCDQDVSESSLRDVSRSVYESIRRSILPLKKSFWMGNIWSRWNSTVVMFDYNYMGFWLQFQQKREFSNARMYNTEGKGKEGKNRVIYLPGRESTGNYLNKQKTAKLDL